jgi:hypothetical protein
MRGVSRGLQNLVVYVVLVGAGVGIGAWWGEHGPRVVSRLAALCGSHDPEPGKIMVWPPDGGPPRTVANWPPED